MAMRRSAKNSSSSKSSGILVRFILWSALIVVIALLCAGFYGYHWIHNYNKSDAFRAQLATQIGRAAKAEAEVEPLTWSGPDVHINQVTLTPKAAQGWKSIGVSGLQATLDFGAVRDGVWRVTRLSTDTVQMGMRGETEIPKSLPFEIEEHVASSIPQWLRGWIPSRTQIDEVQVQTFDLLPPAGTPGISATGITISGKPANDTGAWHLRGQGGKLVLPGILEPLRLTSLDARLDDKAIVFHDAVGRWLGDSEVTARGDLPFDKTKSWDFNGSITGLDLRQLLSADWSSRLGGMMEGDFRAGPAVVKGTVRCKNGIVQNMPVLNQVATFTHVDRFRRIVLDVASADVERSADTIKVTNLNMQSSGLIRVEGGFVIQGGQINGDLLVGVAPDTLTWIPGSQGHVFTQSRADAPGYVWTTVHISGPVGSPSEDLTNRVLVAMGLAPLDVAEKGVEILSGMAGGTGGAKGTMEAAKGVIDAGKGVINGTAGKAVETGVDILKGVVPLLGK
jgi:hypothetical protein